MDQVSKTRQPLTVTRRGKPVVRIVPVEEEAVELEVAALFARGRVRSAGTVWQAVSELLEATGVQVCEITAEIAAAAAQFGAGVPADPADRLIMATALERSAPLVTRDERIRASGACRTVW